MMRGPILLLIAATLSCGGDSNGPKTPSLTGTWRFSYSSMTGTFDGVTVECAATALDFTLSQSGNSFSGVQANLARIFCLRQGTAIVDTNLDQETLVNGSISGSTVSFQLGILGGPNAGTVTGSSMSGTAQWNFLSGNVPVTLTGPFTAAKL